MKLFTTLFLCFCVSFLRSQTDNYVKGEVLVMVDNNLSISNLIRESNAKHANLNAAIKSVVSSKLHVYLVSFSTSFTNQEVLGYFSKSKEVLLAQNNHTNLVLRDSCTTSDTYFASNQWALNNTGQSGGIAGADIDACLAWDLLPVDSIADTTTIGDEIVVAVIDNGFDLSHPDINFFINTNEIPNDGIDNDNNGYIDDISGWNFYSDSNNVNAAFHGTHVSGIIGAKGNNGVGVVGVTPGVKILPIQGSSTNEAVVLQSYGYVLAMRDLYDQTNGVMGAFIVATNSSFGVDFAFEADYPLWCTFYDSLGARGILNVGATTNSNTNVDLNGDIPSTCTSDWLIMVNNTNSSDFRVNSGYGAIHIDLGAPGVSIYSTATGGSYGFSSGTSMATPQVTGTIAFLHAVACSNFSNEYKLNPATTSLLIKEAILNKGDFNTDLDGITVSGKRLNLFQSANEIKTQALCELSSIQENNPNQEITLYPNPSNGNFHLDLSNVGLDQVEVFVYNSLGSLIQREFVTNSIYTINLPSPTKGVHYLKVKSPNNFVYSTTFVVQ